MQRPPQADADILIGTAPQAPLTAGDKDVASCTYQGGPSGPDAQVEVDVGDGAKQQLDIDKTSCSTPSLSRPDSATRRGRRTR